MKQSLFGFFKKAIFGSDEGKAEPATESVPKASSEPLEEKTVTLSTGKIMPGEKPAKKETAAKPRVKTKPKPKAQRKKPGKIVGIKKTMRKKFLAKRKAITAGKMKAAAKTVKKTIPVRKTRTEPRAVKQVWPKPRDSHIRHEHVKKLEQKVSELAAEHNVPSEEVEQAMQMETHEVIRQQASMPHISETEEKIESAKKTAKGMEHHEILGLIEEIQKHRILTDFDRVYDEVTEKKRVSSAKLAHDLEIPKTRVEDCAKILEEDKLVEVDYPPIGDEFLQVTGYSEELKEEKEKQKQAKKQDVKKK